jgi:glutamyl-Q tRNA(Asp) synthetase
VNVERFAPSPTGLLHLGHAFSAVMAFDAASAENGRFLLRIEDIDQQRCKPSFEAAIFEDLAWLGLHWATPVMRQSNRFSEYKIALARLANMGVTYACSCSRRDIAEALSAPQEGEDQHFGPDGIVYPGTCRAHSGKPVSGQNAVRLDMRKAVALLGDFSQLGYQEIGEAAGWYQLEAVFLIESCGDVVLARRDIGTSYHLAVVVDDAAQGVTHVTRGVDMAAATPIHLVLQALLGLPKPVYRHHRLIRDEMGKRLAKRHDALALSQLRAQGWTPADVRAAIKA